MLRAVQAGLRVVPAGPSRLPVRQLSWSARRLVLADRDSSSHLRQRRQQRLPRDSRPSEESTNASSSPPPSSAFPPFAHEGYDPALSGGEIVPSKPVIVPPDPQGVLQDNHAAREILAHDALVIVRQLEMLNVFLGFEQANRYAIHTTNGELVGFMAEEEQSFIGTLSRQALRTHRPFRSVVMDKTGKPVLWIRRPFNLILSKIFVRASEDETGPLVGEAQQDWHLWRRKYSLFQSRGEDTYKQFASVDSGLLAWDFWLKDADDRLVASINRNFRGFGREIFTDTGQYVIRFDAAGTELAMPPGAGINVQGQSLVIPEARDGGLTLDQRAMTLATAVSIDFDYFSRHSGAGGMGFPFFMWGSDGSTEARQGGAGSEGAAGGAAVGAAAGAAGGVDADGRQLSEEEQIYGPQAGQQDLPTHQQGEFGYDEPAGEDDPYGEDLLEDPWGGDDSGGGSWFGGGGGSGGDGGGWGGGDWS